VTTLGTLPPSFAATRESLRALACYAISPARKARTGRIGLRATGTGFGTPPFDDGTRIVVEGEELAVVPGERIRISTVRTAAEFLGVEVSSDPGVGHDLPPFAPDDDLAVDRAASLALGAWYSFGDELLREVAADVPAMTEAQLWPEHFDLAVQIAPDTPHAANVGFSPGDEYSPEPYLYIGPHVRDGLDDPFWNAPFGASIPYSALLGVASPADAARHFIDDGLARLHARERKAP